MEGFCDDSKRISPTGLNKESKLPTSHNRYARINYRSNNLLVNFAMFASKLTRFHTLIVGDTCNSFVESPIDDGLSFLWREANEFLSNTVAEQSLCKRPYATWCFFCSE